MSLTPSADQGPLGVMAALAAGDQERLQQALAEQRAALFERFGDPSTWDVMSYADLSEAERPA